MNTVRKQVDAYSRAETDETLSKIISKQPVDSSANVITAPSDTVALTLSGDSNYETPVLSVFDADLQSITTEIWAGGKIHCASIELTNGTARNNTIYPNQSLFENALYALPQLTVSNSVTLACLQESQTFTGTQKVTSTVSSTVPLSIQAHASQSANLISNLASNGSTVLSGVASNGRYIMATSAGAPTGTPANGTTVLDTTNHRLYIYSSGWKYIALTT